MYGVRKQDERVWLMAKIRSPIIYQGLVYFIGSGKIKTPKLTQMDFRIFKVKFKF